MPPQIVGFSEEEAVSFARLNNSRVFVKVDYTGGGVGVTPCSNEQELLAALRRSDGKPGAGRRIAARSVQHWKPGVPTSVSLAAWRGRIIAGFVFRQI